MNERQTNRQRDLNRIKESITLQERTLRNLRDMSIDTTEHCALAERILSMLKAQLGIWENKLAITPKG